MKRLAGAKGEVFRSGLLIKSGWLSAAILILPLLLLQPAGGRDPAMIDQKETARHLTSHLEALTKKIGERSLERPENLKKTQAYIADFYQGLGVSYQLQTYRYRHLEVANIVAEIPLGDRPARRYLLGAHYDSVAGTVGADDNASAVAVQLETARELKKLGHKMRPDVSVCLVSFALEEPPVYGTDFMGSRVYARKARKEKEQIDGMLCLEMVGYTCRRPGCQAYPFPLTLFNYPETGDFIGVVGNFKSRPLTRDLAGSLAKRPGLPVVRLTVPLSGWILPAVRLSDHAAFWDQGYRAVMLTDSAFYRNPHYHLASDRMETLDIAFMAELVEGLIGFFTSGGGDR